MSCELLSYPGSQCQTSRMSYPGSENPFNAKSEERRATICGFIFSLSMYGSSQDSHWEADLNEIIARTNQNLKVYVVEEGKESTPTAKGPTVTAGVVVALPLTDFFILASILTDPVDTKAPAASCASLQRPTTVVSQLWHVDGAAAAAAGSDAPHNACSSRILLQRPGSGSSSWCTFDGTTACCTTTFDGSGARGSPPGGPGRDATGPFAL